MSDLRDLYQETILDHHKKPRNFRKLDTADRQLEGYNPLCGDKVTVFVKLDGNVIRDVAFQGTGCAISTASASMMTETLKGKTVEEAEGIFANFHKLITAKDVSEVNEDLLGKLAVFGGVREFPMRAKCATLAWHTFHGALHGEKRQISTE